MPCGVQLGYCSEPGKVEPGPRSDVVTLASVVRWTSGMPDVIVMLMRSCTLLNLMLTPFFGVIFLGHLFVGKSSRGLWKGEGGG